MQDNELKNQILQDLRKELLKNEILEELKREYAFNSRKSNSTHYVFNEVRTNNTHGNGFSKLAGSHEGFKAWECIRKLACISVGITYIHNIKEDEIELANRVAEQIYEILIDAYSEHLENNNNS